jgi:uncharacterized PurR-regulated membrane protein YhhQ (DUF165 family)
MLRSSSWVLVLIMAAYCGSAMATFFFISISAAAESLLRRSSNWSEIMAWTLGVKTVETASKKISLM